MILSLEQLQIIWINIRGLTEMLNFNPSTSVVCPLSRNIVPACMSTLQTSLPLSWPSAVWTKQICLIVVLTGLDDLSLVKWSTNLNVTWFVGRNSGILESRTNRSWCQLDLSIFVLVPVDTQDNYLLWTVLHPGAIPGIASKYLYSKS